MGKNSNGNCPYASAFPDYDFAGPAVQLELTDGTRAVFAMQKSAVAWLLDADTLAPITSSLPGGYVGTLVATWGYSYDIHRHMIFAPNANPQHRSWIGLDGEKYCDGAVMGLDADTLVPVWITPTPGSQSGADCYAPLTRDPFIEHIPLAYGAHPEYPMRPLSALGTPSNNVTRNNNFGMVTVANDMVWAGTADGKMQAFDASNGALLFTHDCGSTIYGAASIGPSRVFYGCGYNPPLAVDPRFDAANGAFITLSL